MSGIRIPPRTQLAQKDYDPDSEVDFIPSAQCIYMQKYLRVEFMDSKEIERCYTPFCIIG